MNRVIPTPTFDRRFRQKRRKASQDLVTRIDEKTPELRHAPRPDLVGERKGGPLRGTRGIPLTRGMRLLYTVRRDGSTQVVILLRVCSHEETYAALSSAEQFYIRGEGSQVERNLTATF
jgi:hypothetical protein